MNRCLYHGSEKIVEKPQFGKVKPYNDYGPGFYCTEVFDMAMEWAVGQNRNGYTNVYKINDDGLKILDLSSNEYCILDWLAVLIENREFDIIAPLAVEAKEYISKNFTTQYSSYDIIMGYRADDSYFSFASDFLNGGISYRQLCNAMYLGKLGMQYVIKSEKAFKRLRFINAEIADASKWFPLKSQRDRKARSDYFDREKNRRRKDDIFITDIIDAEMDRKNLLLLDLKSRSTR